MPPQFQIINSSYGFVLVMYLYLPDVNVANTTFVLSCSNNGSTLFDLPVPHVHTMDIL